MGRREGGGGFLVEGSKNRILGNYLHVSRKKMPKADKFAAGDLVFAKVLNQIYYKRNICFNH